VRHRIIIKHKIFIIYNRSQNIPPHGSSNNIKLNISSMTHLSSFSFFRDHAFKNIKLFMKSAKLNSVSSFALIYYAFFPILTKLFSNTATFYCAIFILELIMACIIYHANCSLLTKNFNAHLRIYVSTLVIFFLL